MNSPAHKSRLLDRFLNAVERAGNRLPHPTLLFIQLAIAVLLMSWIASAMGTAATHPVTGEEIVVVNLLSAEGIYKILTHMVSNFTQFAPVGVVLVIMLGVGVAEDSGLITRLIELLTRGASGKSLAYIVSFIGVLSSIGADVGYVVLIPLAGMLYFSLGRPPLAGIAVAFASVSAGFSANLFLGPVDVMLAGISTEAAKLIDNTVTVSPTSNYYFIVASTFLITAICGVMSNRFVEPRLQGSTNLEPISDVQQTPGSPGITEPPRLFAVGWFSLIYIALIAAAILIPGGIFHTGDQNSSGNSILKVLVPVLAIYFGLAGYIFGRSNGEYRHASDAISGMESTMKTMAYYIVLMFFAAQFVSWFNWSNLGATLAIHGAAVLQNSGANLSALLIMLIVISAAINLLIGSASAKWTLVAPIFIPMLLLLGVDPAQTQMAYRIGDSSSNIITPLMPYFGIVLAYAQRFDNNIGLGRIIATMLPYSVALFIVWSALLFLWISFGLPLGF